MKYTENGFLEFEIKDLAYCDSSNVCRVKANRLLREEMEKWQVVYGYCKEASMWDTTKYDNNKDNCHTHTTRLTPPRPIQKDSFEQLTKDLAKADPGLSGMYFIKRARRLLGEK